MPSPVTEKGYHLGREPANKGQRLTVEVLTGGEVKGHFGFQRGVMVASRCQLGFPALSERSPASILWDKSNAWAFIRQPRSGDGQQTFHACTEVSRDDADHLVGPDRGCREGDRDRLARFRRGLEEDQIFRELALRPDR